MGCCGSKKPEEPPQPTENAEPAQEGTQEKEVLEGLRVGKSNFIVGKLVAGGAFGKLHLGRNVMTGLEVAVKMESKSVDKKQLIFEFAFYRLLGVRKGIPKVHYFGPCGSYNALVMDLLGPTLEKMLVKCDGKFGLKTTAQLAVQLLELFEYFHGKGLIYRDTKPENFLLGQTNTDDYNVVHIIDLGLCKEYLDKNQNHIPFAEGKGITGTARYMSINNHLGREQGRRDDLEAVGYLLIYFFKGHLPWMGLTAKTTQQRYKMIADLKQQISVDELCAQMPEEFNKYLNIVRNLEFEDQPKYKILINMFNKLLSKNGFDPNDGFYDWDRSHRPRPKIQRR
jgi:serine/threonine protein kinase